jgi:hypothetical protein
MTTEEAKQVLDSVKDGKDPTVEKINKALIITGDKRGPGRPREPWTKR